MMCVGVSVYVKERENDTERQAGRWAGRRTDKDRDRRVKLAHIGIICLIMMGPQLKLCQYIEYSFFKWRKVIGQKSICHAMNKKSFLFNAKKMQISCKSLTAISFFLFPSFYALLPFFCCIAKDWTWAVLLTP